MYNRKSIRAAAILTNSYVAGTIIGPTENVDFYNQLNIAVKFTIGSLTDARIKVEFSDDGSDYYQETAESVSGGVITETQAYHKYVASGNYVISTPIKWRYVKISAIGTGTVSNSTMTIDAILGKT